MLAAKLYENLTFAPITGIYAGHERAICTASIEGCQAGPIALLHAYVITPWIIPPRAYFYFGRTFDLASGWQRICACAVPHPLCTLTLRRAC